MSFVISATLNINYTGLYIDLPCLGHLPAHDVKSNNTPITRSCSISPSSGKIGKLSTSEHSRSVIGRDPGP